MASLDNTVHLHVARALPLFHSFIIKHCVISLLSVYTAGVVGAWLRKLLLLLLMLPCRWGWDVNKAAVLLARDTVFILGVGRALIED